MSAPLSAADVEAALGRYRSVVEDWDAFVAAVRAPRPAVVWANPERIGRAELAGLLLDAGVSSTPIAWEPSALRLPSMDRPGRHWGHWAGLYYVQEEASLLPVRLLDPRPGERVLDLCAAPGSKTARIAFALGNRGTVVANDRSPGRLAATAATIARLGIRNVTCTAWDGTEYPLRAGRFDKVLVDAPCSAEGAVGKRARGASSHRFRRFITGTQVALLRRAIALCRPGGRVVYSTCSLAPEENEAVIDAVLREVQGVRAVAAPRFEGLGVSRALASFEGARYADGVQHGVRLWPHVSGTGGFFACALEKDAGAPDYPDDSAPVTELGAAASASPVLRRFCELFGIDERALDGMRLLETGRFARLVADDHRVPRGPRHVATGLAVTRNRVKGPKLSTAGALMLGPLATRRAVDLDRAGADAFQSRASLPLAGSSTADVTSGYVVVRSGGHALGLGQLRVDEGALHSEFPKAWARAATGAPS